MARGGADDGPGVVLHAARRASPSQQDWILMRAMSLADGWGEESGEEREGGRERAPGTTK